MPTPNSQETTVEISIDWRGYTEWYPTTEEVCGPYRQELLTILGNTGIVEVDHLQLLIRATFVGKANYLPNLDSSEYGMEGECDTLQLMVWWQIHHLPYCRYGLISVKIDGEERKAA